MLNRPFVRKCILRVSVMFPNYQQIIILQDIP